ncbi:MAG: hypothetical protein KKF85_06605 [Gammaproteobacteria bacterium]|nr:hypothetical protein [Rhodocyclaceae bacterium]MBU3907684.1 hypothetical protein [Gammaproteobacteria bacterium]MBU3989229.1 hypothetical protein [Gammaproteobacteria bacterium]MBU4004330.1 hypothetical protein [Gammaproteobacteria bacterium]MBU4019739.1 hypothetical protein [Gammaproteobacteria bacterium]
MHLTLLVPGLLLPDEIRTDTVFDLTAPRLSLLLGRGQRRELTPDWLPGAFGLSPPLPAAALRKVGAGGTAPGSWICLDPVHLQVAREGISLADPAQLKLTAAEAAALIEVVAPLFADWGTLSASSPSCWELQLNKPVDLTTHPLSDAIGQNVDPGLPGGPDGRAWRRLIAEAQTLMHAHPVNRSRDGLGQPTINSLWAWGLGSLPDAVQAYFNVTWSDDPVLAGLCAAVQTGGGLPCLKPPERFQPASGRVLAVMTCMEHPARTFDALAWREALLALERDWLAPALASLKKRECRELRVIGTSIAGIAGPQRTTAFSLTWNELWRIWRRPRPLTALT